MTTAWDRFLDAPFPGDWQTFAEQARAAALEDVEAAPLPPGMVNAAFCGHCFYGSCQETGCQVPGRCRCSKHEENLL